MAYLAPDGVDRGHDDCPCPFQQRGKVGAHESGQSSCFQSLVSDEVVSFGRLVECAQVEERDRCAVSLSVVQWVVGDEAWGMRRVAIESPEMELAHDPVFVGEQESGYPVRGAPWWLPSPLIGIEPFRLIL